MDNPCCRGCLLHLSTQQPQLSVRYYNQDLHRRHASAPVTREPALRAPRTPTRRKALGARRRRIGTPAWASSILGAGSFGW